MSDDDVAVRLCTRVESMIGEPVRTSVTDECDQCHHAIYVDVAQASPYPELENRYVCTECALEDPEMREAALKALKPIAVLLRVLRQMETSENREEDYMGRHAKDGPADSKGDEHKSGGSHEKETGK